MNLATQERNPIQAREIKDLVTAFLDSQDVRQSSRDTYGRQLRPFLEWVEREEKHNFTRRDILNYKDHLREKELSPFTINGYLIVVKKFFRWAASEGFCKNVAGDIKGVRRARGFMKDPLTVEDVASLLGNIDRSTLEGKRDYALVNLLIRTGLRTIETIRADVGDIRQTSGETVLSVQGKGRDEKDEMVILTPPSLDPIRDYLAARGPLKNTDPLFSGVSNRNTRGRLITRSLRRIIKARFRAAGITSSRLTSHSLRHTAVTLALLGGASLQEVQALARHASITTTQVYAHNIDRMGNAAEKKIDAMLEGVA